MNEEIVIIAKHVADMGKDAFVWYCLYKLVTDVATNISWIVAVFLIAPIIKTFLESLTYTD